MTKRIRPYNYSYRCAYRILKETPTITLAFLVIRVINELNPKYNYSKEGVRRAWDDFRATYDTQFLQSFYDRFIKVGPMIGSTDMSKIVGKHLQEINLIVVDDLNDD